MLQTVAAADVYVVVVVVVVVVFVAAAVVVVVVAGIEIAAAAATEAAAVESFANTERTAPKIRAAVRVDAHIAEQQDERYTICRGKRRDRYLWRRHGSSDCFQGRRSRSRRRRASDAREDCRQARHLQRGEGRRRR